MTNRARAQSEPITFRWTAATAGPPLQLDRREHALVALLAAGHTDASAARRLRVSARTVTNMLRSLMDRLEVNNRFQLGLALGARSPRKAIGGASAALPHHRPAGSTGADRRVRIPTSSASPARTRSGPDSSAVAAADAGR